MCKQCLQHGGSRETDDSGYHHPLQFITTYRRTQHSTLDIGPGIGIANFAIIRPGPPKHFAPNWLVDGWIQARAALLTAPCF